MKKCSGKNEGAWPFILGCLFSAVSASLLNLPNVHLEKKPRMADFAKRMTAAESGLGWEPGSFMTAYNTNREEIIISTFDSNPVAQLILSQINYQLYPSGWRGTANDLLLMLNSKASTSVNAKFWPNTASAMGTALRRISPNLRKIGYEIEKKRGAKPMITILPPSTRL